MLPDESCNWIRLWIDLVEFVGFGVSWFGLDLKFGNELRFGVGFGGFGVVWCGLGSGLVDLV